MTRPPMLDVASYRLWPASLASSKTNGAASTVPTPDARS
jgi:hypothetical protein